MFKHTNKFLPRAALVALSAALMGLGISLYYLAGAGSDPMSVLVQAVSLHTGLSVGVGNTLVNALLVAAFFFLTRRRLGWGTLIQALLVGPCINLFLPLLGRLLPGPLPLWAGLLLCLPAAFLVGLSVAVYLPCDLGASAMDLLILAVADWTRGSYRRGSWLTYLLFFAAGALLGGQWGLGTLVAVFGTGVVADWLIPRLARAEGRWFAPTAPAA